MPQKEWWFPKSGAEGRVVSEVSLPEVGRDALNTFDQPLLPNFDNFGIIDIRQYFFKKGGQKKKKKIYH